MHPSDIIGSIAAIAMVFGYLPQTVRTVRTRSTDDIATGTFLMMGFGSACFAVQGILTGNIPLFVTNLLTTIIRSSSGSRSTTTITKRDGRRPSHDIDENL